MPRKPSLHSLQASIRRLDNADVQALLLWLFQYQQERQPLSTPVTHNGRNGVDRHQVGRSTFLLQGVRCSKENCKCAVGDLHGPYWYEYRRIDGILKKKYHGVKRGPSKFD